jgi:hypothetical protein
VQQWAVATSTSMIRDTPASEKFMIQTLGDQEDITDKYQPGVRRRLRRRISH